MLVRAFLLGMISCLLSVPTLAVGTHSSYESMLTPGARLVVGDATKNEFFIVGKDEGQSSYTIPTHKMIPHIKTALNNPENQAHANKLRAALHRAIHKSTSKLNRKNHSHYVAHSHHGKKRLAFKKKLTTNKKKV